MSTPLKAFYTGTFTSAGTAVNLPLPGGVQRFEMVNITDFGSTAANTNVMRAKWYSSLANGSAFLNLKTSGAATLALESMITTDGFSFVSDSGSALPSAAVAVTSTTNAAPPVVSTGSTAGLSNFDVIRYINAPGQLNISGMDFTINNIVANTSFELIYMGAPGAAGTGGFWRRIPFNPRFYPRNRFITAITKATSAVVTLSVTHGYTVGQLVRVIVPSAFGMTEINGLLGTVTAINTTNNTITLNIDSSGFTTFAFPTSAVAATGVSFAQIVPVGEAAVNSSSQPFANLLDDATDNQSFTGLVIGTGAQTSGKLYQWIAEEGVLIP